MWNGPTFQAYYARINEVVWEFLNRQDVDYLLRVDFDEYLDYLVGEFEWEPLEWSEVQMTVDPIRKKAQRARNIDGKSITVDEEGFRLRVPVSPHSHRDRYFEYGPPTTWTGTSEPAWRFEGDVLCVEVAQTKQAVEKATEDIRFWLGGRNAAIEVGNRTLRDRIRNVWVSKRKRLEEQESVTQAVLEELKIPLHRDPEASAKPVDMKKRELRTVASPPKAKPAPREMAVSREEVIALIDFIEQYARQFEVTPKTYVNMGEEELRDLIIGMMNANYPGSTTAETFSKLGKSDISLQMTPGHVLICECKKWSGEKAYGKSIDQLFRYLTWRQNYGVLIHFCMLKNMTSAVASSKEAVGNHSSFTAGTLHAKSDTRFLSRHTHPQDTGKSVEIHHLFFDLSV